MGLDRRGFITFLVGGVAGTLLTPIPYKLADDISIWSQNWSWIPKNIDGATSYKATVSKLCPSACGLKVRLVGKNPIRAVGNPDHPLSKGKISALAAAEVQMLYSPGRVKRPLRKSADGVFTEISWGEAMAILQEKIGSIKGVPGKLALISGDENGTVNEVLAAFAAKIGSVKDFYIMPGEAQTAAVALKAMGGKGQFGYDIENADYVLGIGADFLESWGTVVRNRRAFAETHPHGEEASAKYVYAGPVQNNTAAGAETWMPIKPGSEIFLALGLANLLLQHGRSAYAIGGAEFTSLAQQFTPAKVANLTGLPVPKIEALVKGLLAANKPLVLIGSPFGQGAGAAAVMAGAALNMLLSGMNGGGLLRVLPDLPAVVDGAPERMDMLSNDLVGFLKAVGQGKASAPEVLFAYEANPVFALPEAAAVRETLAQIPFKVSFSQFLDDTASLCDLVLPNPAGLERYDDVVTPYGAGQNLISWAVPVQNPPVCDARPTGDLLLELAAKLGMDLGFASLKEVLEAKAQAAGADAGALEEGEVWTSETTAGSYLSLRADILAKAAAEPKGDGSPVLAPICKLNFGTAESGIPPFALKTIREHELKKSYGYVQLNGKTASKNGVGQGSLVKLKAPAGECVALVNINEGVMDDVVAASLNLGHDALGPYTEGKGDNIAKLMTVDLEPGTGLPIWNGSRVKIEKA